MDLPIGIQKQEFWKRHIDQVRKFKGSQRAYAAENGITLSQLVYYRQKFRQKSAFARVVAKEAEISSKPESKCNVENFATYPQRLPDAKWVAALILELHR